MSNLTISFRPTDWYYQVGNDPANVYSSARGNFFPAADAGYQAWLAGPENMLSVVETKAAIGASLASYQQVKTPIDPGVLAGWQAARQTIAPTIVASARATVQAGAITLTATPFNIASATYLAKGNFRFAFAKPLPDSQYAAMITAAGASAEEANLTTAGFDINVGHGPSLTAFDPKYVDVLVYRK
jgi:hypothetical protein